MARIWNKFIPFSNGAGTPLKRKVFVAMSGGVDSSVAAALLKKQGYLVTGGFMKNFSAESWNGVVDKDCPWQRDMEDARKVCEKIGIEFRSSNFEKEYREKVIEYFFSEYAAGRTPNPDIMCNQEIKFGIFLEKALEMGFDYIATGHYARVVKSGIKNYELWKGKDIKKDQSYFLYILNQFQLARTLFPIGEYTKAQVRELARQFGLHNTDKKDSQGVCFIGHINLREFLKQRLPERTGEIVDPSGRVIGTHPGAWYYTIGQRHGLGIGGGAPYYVAQKDVINNRLIVDAEFGRLVYQTRVELSDVHWIGNEPAMPYECKAKIRYQQAGQDCTVERSGDGIVVKFKRPQFAPAPGQSIVFYDNDMVLGGAVMEE